MRTPRRRSILALLGCAAATAAAVPIIAISAPPAGTKAPDLRADPVEEIEGPAVYGYSDVGSLGENRLLVRFNGFVTNVGTGPLEVSGNPQVVGGVKQLAWSAGQTTGAPAVDVTDPDLKVAYEEADGHNHFHLKRAMEYSLWNQSKTALAAPGQKVGFCLYDSQPATNAPVSASQVYVDSVTHFCEAGRERSSRLRMGVSPGWRDMYGKWLAFQWVDVSATAPGVYWVASQGDPDDSVWEGDGSAETNTRTFATKSVTVPGYIARPVTTTQTNAPQSISLVTTSFGAPGPRTFRIVTPPAHGTLGVAPGQAFAGPSITYTPQAGYGGPDSFTYVARDADSDFPSAGSEPVATVSLLSAAPSVAISGAPQTLIAGTSAQLQASLANLPGGVTWSTTAGAITPGGLLTAPATPPAGGALTVRATSVSNPGVYTEAVIAVTAAPVAQPAPLPGPTPVVTGTASRKLLSRLTVGHSGPRIVIGTVTTGPKAGRIDVIVALKGRVLGRCGARVGARKTVSCKIVMAESFPLTKVRITVKLKIRGVVTSVRRAYVVTPRAARG